MDQHCPHATLAQRAGADSGWTRARGSLRDGELEALPVHAALLTPGKVQR